jgi:hypothetical protein
MPSNYGSLMDYINGVSEGKAPCDHCNKKLECQEFELACRAFSYYVLHGSFYEHTPRHPTRGLFNKIFKEDDKALKNYLKSLKANSNDK